MGTRPKIGLTMRLEMETDRFYLGRHYSEALVAVGADPVYIPLIPDADYIASVVADLDGILLPGCDTDVDPHRFGQEPMPQLGTVIDIKDETDFLVLAEAEKRNLPIFGICFGMQVMNVFYGGTLYQDIYTQVPGALKHQQGKPLERNSHSIRIKEGSLIGELAGSETGSVNSHHHQAVDRVAEKFEATTWAADGIIETIEGDFGDRFVIGVQWHPELSWNSDGLSNALFKRFVSEAKKFTKNK
jgi:putative glutamine amidotransferase